MKKRLFIILVLVAMLLLGACGAKQTADSSRNEMAYDMNSTMSAEDSAPMPMVDGDMYYGEEAAEEAVEEAGGGQVGETNFSEKIIYNVDMSVQVDEPSLVSDDIKAKVNELGGYVSYSNESKYDGNKNYVSLQVRVPSKGLNDLTEYIDSIGEVQYENMFTDNITESYYDTVTRLDHEQLQAKQLEELMEKAETIEEILLVRQQLSTVQENVEIYQGRIRRWDSLVDYSTVTIQISPTPTLDNSTGLMRFITTGETGRKIIDGFKNSAIFIWNALSIILIIIAILIIPAVIIVPIVIIIVRSSKKNKAKRMNKKHEDWKVNQQIEE